MKKYRLNEFINGMTQGFLAPRGYYLREEAGTQTKQMLATGINWVVLCVNQFQETFASTRIFPDNVRTISDEELRIQIRRLKESGTKVILKPMVEPLDSIWRGNIRLHKGNIIADTVTDNVTTWFDSYREMLRRYAEIAAETECEMFCVGCELDGIEHQCEQWLKTIKMVRNIYPGLLTYNMDRDLDNLIKERKWLAELDIVGISGYFKVGPADRSSSLEEMINGWTPYIEKLKKFSEWLNRPLFFIETGARPIMGTAGITGDFNTNQPVYSEQEQADYYLAMQYALQGEAWYYGSVWWKWDEFQHRPHYYLEDGHYVGCEPAPLMQQYMREWCKKSLPQRTLITTQH